MKKNIGPYDRALRLVISVGLFVIAALHMVPGYWNIVTWCLAAILLLTALLGTCMLYKVFGIDTRKQAKTTNIKHDIP